jgi:D-beta-D-heptose 7-phosphate kinase/D-beta-D-heptose 1-phosphate adenosyltransferase
MAKKSSNPLDGFWRKGDDILVVGDVMLDEYVKGEATRISPEGPIMVLKVDYRHYRPGGAGNVAANVAALGGHAFLTGVIGKDAHAKALLGVIWQPDMRGAFVEDDRPTTTKTRFLGQHDMPLPIRCDEEFTAPISGRAQTRICDTIRKTKASAIIISDYAKGAITQRVYDNAKAIADKRYIPLLVDPKPEGKVNYYGASVIKFNHTEACRYLGVKEENGEGIKAIGKRLVESLDANIVITRAEEGVSIFYKDGRTADVPTQAREVADVSGAGDTFIAALAMGYSRRLNNLEHAVRIANVAAGIKVATKAGAVPVRYEELREAMR